MVVAGVSLGAQLAQLLGAHPAAATAVLHQTHPGRALGRGCAALALPAAILAGHLLAGRGEVGERGGFMSRRRAKTERTPTNPRSLLRKLPGSQPKR